MNKAWLENHLLSCPSKSYFAIDCPGCGFQRSILYLLDGDISLSWSIYPPTIFILCTVFLLLLHLVFKLQSGHIFIKFSFIITTIVIAINYIFKIINHQLI